MRTDARVEDLLRELAPRVLGALVRRYGDFDACEDAVQEALLAAAVQWPDQGIPVNPSGWLIAVAARRMADQVRGEVARRRREEAATAQLPADAFVAADSGDEPSARQDDTLTLLFLCCHPALSPASQVALTLRAVGGLTTAEIARAFLVRRPWPSASAGLNGPSQSAASRSTCPQRSRRRSGCAWSCMCSTCWPLVLQRHFARIARSSC